MNPDFQQLVDRDFFRKRAANVSGSGSHQPSAKKACRRSSQVDDNRQHSKQRSGSGGHPRRQHHETEFESQSVTDLRRTLSAGNDFSFDDKDKSELSLFESQSTVETDCDGTFDLADALDMSWSAILSRNIREQRIQPALQSQRQTSYQHHCPTSASPTSGFLHRSTSSGTTGSTGSTSHGDDDDDELDEFIRARVETDNEEARLTSDAIVDRTGCYVIGDGVTGNQQAKAFAEQTTAFGMSLEEPEELLLEHHHDPLDLTIHGVGLHPPDWWNTLDIGDDFDGFATVSATIGGNEERFSQQLPPRDEAPHPWAENRDDRSSGDGRHSALDEVDDAVERNGLSRLFENADLASSFDEEDQLLLMALSAETPDDFDEF